MAEILANRECEHVHKLKPTSTVNHLKQTSLASQKLVCEQYLAHEHSCFLLTEFLGLSLGGWGRSELTEIS